MDIQVSEITFDLKRAELERKHLLGAPLYFQPFLIRELTPSISFTGYMVYFAEQRRLPDYLLDNLELWSDVAEYWLKDENSNRFSSDTMSKLLVVLGRSRAHEMMDPEDPKHTRFKDIFTKALRKATELKCMSRVSLLARIKEFSYLHAIQSPGIH